jgi:hypothetical protein
MTLRLRGLASIPLLFLAAACASTAVDFERISDPRFVAEDGSFTLELPVGWSRHERALTRDGWQHQTITFNSGAVLEPAEGRPIDASAPELLSAMQDELAHQPGIELLECRAAQLDSLSAFRMHFRRLPEDGAPAGPAQQAVLYAAIDGRTLYALSLENARAETFADDLADFERMVASFRRTPGGKAP